MLAPPQTLPTSYVQPVSGPSPVRLACHAKLALQSNFVANSRYFRVNPGEDAFFQCVSQAYSPPAPSPYAPSPYAPSPMARSPSYPTLRPSYSVRPAASQLGS